MNKEKVLEVLELYRKELELLGIEANQVDHYVIVSMWDDRHELLAHCLGMIPQMIQFIADDRMDKVFRWLGFIQGVLWSGGLYTLEQLKNHNRPFPIQEVDMIYRPHSNEDPS